MQRAKGAYKLVVAMIPIHASAAFIASNSFNFIHV